MARLATRVETLERASNVLEQIEAAIAPLKHDFDLMVSNVAALAELVGQLGVDARVEAILSTEPAETTAVDVTRSHQTEQVDAIASLHTQELKPLPLVEEAHDGDALPYATVPGQDGPFRPMPPNMRGKTGKKI